MTKRPMHAFGMPASVRRSKERTAPAEERFPAPPPIVFFAVYPATLTLPAPLSVSVAPAVSFR